MTARPPSGTTPTVHLVTFRLANEEFGLHIMSVDELDLMVIEVSGGLIPDGFTRLPSLEDLKQNTFRRDSFYSGEQDEHWYAFLLPLESPLVDFAHHALVNGHAVDCYGSLADEQAELHKMVGMPFLLESMSLYG